VPGGQYTYWDLEPDSTLIITFARDEVIEIRYSSTRISSLRVD